ncbi:MAG TPA: guanylate kinase [Paracoccaceae bacterium]|nr:guanylate kinase [Paracoccaceae bacterium]
MIDTADRNGILIVLSSPSGAGKSTMTRRLLDEHPDIRLSVSVTTRLARPGEVDGRDYVFISRELFARMVSASDLLEHADVFGHRYGTPRAPVEASLASGQDMIFDVDWQGAQQLRLSALGPSVVSIFLLPPSIAALEVRLRARAQDSDEVIAGRMAKARAEISHWAEYDYVLVNDDLDRCYAQIGTIVEAERLKLRRQRGIRGFVDRLNEEFDARQEGA